MKRYKMLMVVATMFFLFEGFALPSDAERDAMDSEYRAEFEKIKSVYVSNHVYFTSLIETVRRKERTRLEKKVYWMRISKWRVMNLRCLHACRSSKRKCKM